MEEREHSNQNHNMKKKIFVYFCIRLLFVLVLFFPILMSFTPICCDANTTYRNKRYNLSTWFSSSLLPEQIQHNSIVHPSKGNGRVAEKLSLPSANLLITRLNTNRNSHTYVVAQLQERKKEIELEPFNPLCTNIKHFPPILLKLCRFHTSMSNTWFSQEPR